MLLLQTLVLFCNWTKKGPFVSYSFFILKPSPDTYRKVEVQRKNLLFLSSFLKLAGLPHRRASAAGDPTTSWCWAWTCEGEPGRRFCRGSRRVSGWGVGRPRDPSGSSSSPSSATTPGLGIDVLWSSCLLLYVIYSSHCRNGFFVLY